MASAECRGDRLSDGAGGTDEENSHERKMLRRGAGCYRWDRRCADQVRIDAL